MNISLEAEVEKNKHFPRSWPEAKMENLPFQSLKEDAAGHHKDTGNQRNARPTQVDAEAWGSQSGHRHAAGGLQFCQRLKKRGEEKNSRREDKREGQNDDQTPPQKEYLTTETREDASLTRNCSDVGEGEKKERKSYPRRARW